jgi:hypothetical protein
MGYRPVSGGLLSAIGPDVRYLSWATPAHNRDLDKIFTLKREEENISTRKD